jgi:uncharacterized membrane protein
MSIENSWSQINDLQDDDLSAMLHQTTLPKFPSHNPLVKLKKNILTNMIWAILIGGLYIGIIIYFPIWQVQTTLGMVLIFTLWGAFTAFIEYKKINTRISTANSLLTELKRNHGSITNWMNKQQRIALFIYPVAAAGGFMLGGVVGSGKSLEVFMSKPIIWIILLIAIVILVPICYYLAKWMCKYSFGKHLDQLQQNIKELEEEK